MSDNLKLWLCYITNCLQLFRNKSKKIISLTDITFNLPSAMDNRHCQHTGCPTGQQIGPVIVFDMPSAVEIFNWTWRKSTARHFGCFTSPHLLQLYIQKVGPNTFILTRICSVPLFSSRKGSYSLSHRVLIVVSWLSVQLHTFLGRRGSVSGNSFIYCSALGRCF